MTVFIPIESGGKRPLVSKWSDEDYVYPEPEVGLDENIALRCDGLVVIDCDNEEAIRWWSAQPGSATPCKVRTPRGMHFYYLLTEYHHIPQAGRSADRTAPQWGST